MVVKTVFVLCAQALLIQVAFGKATGNSYVNNDIYISGGTSASSASKALAELGLPKASNAVAELNLGGSGYGLGGAGLSLGGSGYSLGGSSLGLGSSGYSMVSGLGYGSAGLGLAAGSIGSGLINGGGLNVVSGGPLLVTSISPIGPSGLAVASENVIEGVLTVTGQLPFLSAVAFEGALPTAGSGVATCGCGSGQVGIVSEGFGRPQVYY
ncbi:hypothetical protein ABMA28_011120 [Loxostege sticticalis]|uniref:Uncharacterized protein n=1 Tax=Loxostege sticticalis TaxID=481309 RepID=A0ABD0S6C9_LOXSC